MSRTLWTCKGCGVHVTTDEGPLERLARGDAPMKEGNLQWQAGHLLYYKEEERTATETPPFMVEEEAYCCSCAQPCDSCGATIFSRSELEAGDSYAAGSSFLPAGKFMKDDALCVDCFEECCSQCGASPTEECTCNQEDNEDGL